jgi:hypothetical protein
VQRQKRLGVKKHDEKSAPTIVVETDANAAEVQVNPARRSAVALDAPLGSKLDAIGDADVRALVAARLRLIEANLLGRIDLDATPAASPQPEGPAAVDVEKAKAIAAQLRKKPQA